MKLMTLNTHSLLEENGPQKLEWFIEGILRERPDLIALQEVNQTIAAPAMDPSMLEGLFCASGYGIIREDNYAAHVTARLRKAGIACSWSWVPVKRGYGIYDEGLAVISLGRPIRKAESAVVSRSKDYENWKTRKVLGILLEGLEDWFYCVHLGWWDDREEPFAEQLERLNAHLNEKRRDHRLWLMGDFNAPAEFTKESYDAVKASGWLDTFDLAMQRDGAATVPGKIDGWNLKQNGQVVPGMRMDQIWVSREHGVLSSRVLFDGIRGKQVSDHFAVMIETTKTPWESDG